MPPQRIQLSRAKGFNLQAASMALNGLPAVKVDRSTPYGNPFRKAGSQMCVVDAFRDWIKGEHVTAAWDAAHAARGLRGKNLACWCRLDAKCHADVLLEIANAENA